MIEGRNIEVRRKGGMKKVKEVRSLDWSKGKGQ